MGVLVARLNIPKTILPLRPLIGGKGSFIDRLLYWPEIANSISKPRQRRWGRGSGPGGPSAIFAAEPQIGRRIARLTRSWNPPELSKTLKRPLTRQQPTGRRESGGGLHGKKASKPRSCNSLKACQRHGWCLRHDLDYPDISTSPTKKLKRDRWFCRQVSVRARIAAGSSRRGAMPKLRWLCENMAWPGVVRPGVVWSGVMGDERSTHQLINQDGHC